LPKSNLRKRVRLKWFLVEVVLEKEKLSGFGDKKKGKLLAFLSNLTGTDSSKLSITKLSAGSVHAVIDMPQHAAYVVKTAALNRDASLLEYGINAVRLNGEENYVLVNTGEIGPLNFKPRPSLLWRIFMTLFGLAIAATIIVTASISFGRGYIPFFATATGTFTVTPTLTYTPTSTQTLTPTSTPHPR